MRISHGTRIRSWHDNNGYGYATNRILSSLHTLGYEVRQNDPSADVQLWFDQPHHWKWNESNQYRIGYHPWESTEMKKEWKVAMNKCDEIWTPSPLIAEWYQMAGIKVPVYVYEHGVDHDTWTYKERRVDDKLRFLHVGGEAARKGADIVLDAFRVAFEGRDDIELTLKMNQQGWNIPKYGKVNILPNLMSLDDLVELYHSHHVFVYPSWGEGFGLNPLQAMATGMPTLCTGAWAPYSKFIPQDFWIESELTDSPWPKLHPGKMFKPDFDDLVEKMRWVADNFDTASTIATTISPLVHEHYDWYSLTESSFKSLENRLKNIS